MCVYWKTLAWETGEPFDKPHLRQQHQPRPTKSLPGAASATGLISPARPSACGRISSASRQHAWAEFAKFGAALRLNRILEGRLNLDGCFPTCPASGQDDGGRLGSEMPPWPEAAGAGEGKERRPPDKSGPKSKTSRHLCRSSVRVCDQADQAIGFRCTTPAWSRRSTPAATPGPSRTCDSRELDRQLIQASHGGGLAGADLFVVVDLAGNFPLEGMWFH